MDKFNLSDSVKGMYFNSEKFKTEKLSLFFYIPLDKQTVPALCLLASMLPDGCSQFKKPIDMSRECDRLYGASISSDAAKLGNSLMLHFSVLHLCDRFADAEIAKDARSLLLKTVFEPNFDPDNFKNAQRLQLDEIKAIINDKRTYARSKCGQSMFENDPFGVILPGDAKQVEALTLDDIKSTWQNLMKNAFVVITHHAQQYNPDVFSAVQSYLDGFDRSKAATPSVNTPCKINTTPKYIEEKLPIAQGKLVLGFKTDVFGEDSDTYKMMVMCDILGGGTYSLLFSNVREKMSLCYYCAAVANRRKGFFMVDSGVEFTNMDKAEKEILNQLNQLKCGNLPDGALQSSKKALCQSLDSTVDSQTVTDRWHAERAFDSNPLTPQQLKEKINSITEQDIVDMANRCVLDTVYKLVEE